MLGVQARIFLINQKENKDKCPGRKNLFPQQHRSTEECNEWQHQHCTYYPSELVLLQPNPENK